jgi:4-amino-4-deoxy-L-arabinose transferase-like glycosyltransferase
MREAWRPFGLSNFLRTVWIMRPLTAAAMILLVAGPWYIAVGIRTDGAFLQEFIAVHHLQRFASAMDSHSGPIFYYVPAILVGLFPWSIFAVPAGLLWARNLYRGNSCPRVMLFITCWVGVYVGLFSLASTKLPNYVLPAYPALAIMVGYFLDKWIRNAEQVHRGWLRVALGVPVMIGLAAVVLLPLSGMCELGGQSLLDRCHLSDVVQRDIILLGLVGLPPLLGGTAALVLAERGKVKQSVASVCITAVLTMVCLWTYAAPQVDRFQAPQDMAQWLRDKNANRPYRLAQFRFFRPSMVYYSDHAIEAHRTPTEIKEFMASNDRTYVITNDVEMEWLQYVLPADFEVVHRTSRFPEKGEILLLSRPANPVCTEAPGSIANAKSSALEHR